MRRQSYEEHIERAASLTAKLFRSRYGLWGLGIISFVESALVVPIITDPFLVVYILANRARTVAAIIVTTLTSVGGGIVAYVLALAFFDFVAAEYLVGSFGQEFYRISEGFRENMVLLTMLGAFTPIPYTLAALAAGFVQGNFLLFVLASFFGRGTRYALVGYLTYRFGEQALTMARRQIHVVTIVLFVLIAVYFFLRA